MHLSYGGHFVDFAEAGKFEKDGPGRDQKGDCAVEIAAEAAAAVFSGKMFGPPATPATSRTSPGHCTAAMLTCADQRTSRRGTTASRPMTAMRATQATTAPSTAPPSPAPDRRHLTYFVRQVSTMDHMPSQESRETSWIPMYSGMRRGVTAESDTDIQRGRGLSHVPLMGRDWLVEAWWPGGQLGWPPSWPKHEAGPGPHGRRRRGSSSP